jgi:hypothetical protein
MAGWELIPGFFCCDPSLPGCQKFWAGAVIEFEKRAAKILNENMPERQSSDHIGHKAQSD